MKITTQDVLNFAISYRSYHECMQLSQPGGIAVWGRDLLEQADKLGITEVELPTMHSLEATVIRAERKLAEIKAAEEAELKRQNTVRARLRLISGGAA